MDQTAIQPEIKAPLAAAPQVGVNGIAAPTPEAAMKPAPKGKHPAYRALEFLADLRITVALFVLALLIVFWGTLAQVDLGGGTVVRTYFRSFFVWVPLKVVFFNSVNEKLPIPFPGGWLIGGAMLVNLLAAHAMRFKLAWNRAGILIIHSGLIVIMVGEFITGVFAVEGQMHILIGQSANQVMELGTAEFVVIRALDVKQDEVIAVPKARLKAGEVIDDPNLPFKIKITDFMVNSDYAGIPRDAKRDPDARGKAREVVLQKLTEVSGVDPAARVDVPAMAAILTTHDGKPLGKWIFQAQLENQFIQIGDKEYQLALRYKHTNRPFNFHLTDFKHDVFVGTATAKDYHSYIQIHDREQGDRPVEIYMNAPLHYRGETFYQSQVTYDPMTQKANGTVLQVVSNPGWVMPYLACFLVGVGLLMHFGLTLYKFIDKRTLR